MLQFLKTSLQFPYAVRLFLNLFEFRISEIFVVDSGKSKKNMHPGPISRKSLLMPTISARGQLLRCQVTQPEHLS